MFIDIERLINERNNEPKRESKIDKMYNKVSISSSREDIENSVRIKLDSLETIFAEILTLPTNQSGFQKVQ